MRAQNPFAKREHWLPGSAMDRFIHEARLRTERLVEQTLEMLRHVH
ncbi:hypothetical protein A7982_12597 [Minicystis rosea]|nr:hypothetical protein A7982_12597 [Minicystis rosea]